jgi:hypothetical protein
MGVSLDALWLLAMTILLQRGMRQIIALCLAAPESQIATCAGEAGPKVCPAPRIASRNHCVEQVSLTPFMVRVALCPLIQNSMSASA